MILSTATGSIRPLRVRRSLEGAHPRLHVRIVVVMFVMEVIVVVVIHGVQILSAV